MITSWEKVVPLFEACRDEGSALSVDSTSPDCFGAFKARVLNVSAQPQLLSLEKLPSGSRCMLDLSGAQVDVDESALGASWVIWVATKSWRSLFTKPPL